ncbi:MAG: hypothetical protein KDB03_11385 [Planctomycetales bacterium]|nr:hypothetical protein [Planctomycetales bacterium]
MQQLKLVGLILFVTAIFLGLAAAVTQTRQVRVKKPTGSQWTSGQEQEPAAQAGPIENSQQGNSTIEPTPSLPWGQVISSENGQVQEGNSVENSQMTEVPIVEFRPVPIGIPLAILGAAGLILWLMPIPQKAKRGAPRRSRRRR